MFDTAETTRSSRLLRGALTSLHLPIILRSTPLADQPAVVAAPRHLTLKHAQASLEGKIRHMEYQSALVILNPAAGQDDPAKVRTLIEERFTQEQLRYEIRETKEAGDALQWAEHAADEGFDVVVVSGGDGTVMEAMSGLIKSGSTIPLAQLPAGTANLLARALSIPTEQAGALDVLFTGTSTRLDVGYLPPRKS